MPPGRLQPQAIIPAWSNQSGEPRRPSPQGQSSWLLGRRGAVVAEQFRRATPSTPATVPPHNPAAAYVVPGGAALAVDGESAHTLSPDHHRGHGPSAAMATSLGPATRQPARTAGPYARSGTISRGPMHTDSRRLSILTTAAEIGDRDRSLAPAAATQPAPSYSDKQNAATRRVTSCCRPGRRDWSCGDPILVGMISYGEIDARVKPANPQGLERRCTLMSAAASFIRRYRYGSSAGTSRICG